MSVFALFALDSKNLFLAAKIFFAIKSKNLFCLERQKRTKTAINYGNIFTLQKGFRHDIIKMTQYRLYLNTDEVPCIAS